MHWFQGHYCGCRPVLTETDSNIVVARQQRICSTYAPKLLAIISWGRVAWARRSQAETDMRLGTKSHGGHAKHANRSDAVNLCLVLQTWVRVSTNQGNWSQGPTYRRSASPAAARGCPPSGRVLQPCPAAPTTWAHPRRAEPLSGNIQGPATNDRPSGKPSSASSWSALGLRPHGNPSPAERRDRPGPEPTTTPSYVSLLVNVILDFLSHNTVSRQSYPLRSPITVLEGKPISHQYPVICTIL